jgi:uncharacterized protein YkwD
MLLAAIAGAAVLARAASGRDAPAAPAAPIVGDSSFGDGLRALGYAEAIEDGRVTTALQQLAALNELAALQNLAALANWPQPQPAPAPIVRRAQAPPPAARTEPWTDVSFAAAVLDGINARRGAAGLPPLRHDSRLAQAASSYALLMATSGSFGHSIDGSTLGSRLAAAGVSEPVLLGEVIAWSGGSPAPAVFVELWMNSGVHRDQILNAGYRLAGAGCAFEGDVVYCVVDFAG